MDHFHVKRNTALAPMFFRAGRATEKIQTIVPPPRNRVKPNGFVCFQGGGTTICRFSVALLGPKLDVLFGSFFFPFRGGFWLVSVAGSVVFPWVAWFGFRGMIWAGLYRVPGGFMSEKAPAERNCHFTPLFGLPRGSRCRLWTQLHQGYRLVKFGDKTDKLRSRFRWWEFGSNRTNRMAIFQIGK